jgi:hypothetical protein
MQEGDTWVPCTNHQHEVRMVVIYGLVPNFVLELLVAK